MDRQLLTRLGILASLAVAASAGAWWLLRVEPPPPSPEGSRAPVERGPEREVPARAGPAVFPRDALFGAEFMGINEAVGFPAESLGGLRAPLWEQDTLRRRAEATRELGVTLVRASSHVWPYLNHQQILERGDLQQVDRFFATASEFGLDLVMVIGPWPGARTAAHTDRYLPDDLEAYAAWVRGVVERYDGDGVDDMPGLTARVVAWEIDNEPDLHNAEPPRGVEPEDAIEGFETPREYASLLLVTAQAIREADPDAFVLSGGIYRPMTASGRAYLEQVLELPGVRDAIDGVSLHCYFSENNLGRVRETMVTARELAPDHAIWITETSVPSEGRGPWVNPDWQARMLVAIYGSFLAEGADRVLWHSLNTPPTRSPGQPRGFGSNALFENVEGEGWVPRPAAQAYQRLAEHLATVELDSVHELAVSGGRLLATDQGWLAFHGEPHPPEQARMAQDLMTGERYPVLGPVRAPAWLEP